MSVPLDELRNLVSRWDDIRTDFEARAREADGVGYDDGMAEGARSAAMELQRVIDRHATVHVVCRTCATERYGTDREQRHEVVTDSDSLVESFRMGHHGHDVRQVVVG